jgi:two-component system response regulator YesN
MLEELGLPLDLVGEATNGEEMTALVGRYLPDVAFVDIHMPKLNGLETIRLGKQVSPHTKWFILSGFPEFDYAQRPSVWAWLITC